MSELALSDTAPSRQASIEPRYLQVSGGITCRFSSDFVGLLGLVSGSSELHLAKEIEAENYNVPKAAVLKKRRGDREN